MATDFCIKGNIAIITGAADGIGKGVCYKFAKEGCHLALVDINSKKLNKVSNDLKSLYPSLNIHGFICDVSNEKSIHELVNKIKHSFNTDRIQILFNNAGIWYDEILYGDINTLRKTMDINVWSMIYTTKAFKQMLLQNEYNKQCYIINTGSMASIISGRSMYGVTKHATIALSEAISNEFRKYHPKSNILVSTLTPQYVSTNLPENSKKQHQQTPNGLIKEVNSKMFEITAIDIYKCADIVYEAMKNKQTVIPTNREFYEAAIKDRMSSLLECKPDFRINFRKSLDNVLAKYYIKHYKHLLPSKL
eukprot:158880_1